MIFYKKFIKGYSLNQWTSLVLYVNWLKWNDVCFSVDETADRLGWTQELAAVALAEAIAVTT